MPGLQFPIPHKSHSIAMSKLKATKGRSNTSVSKWSVDIDMSNVVSVQKILRVKCKPSTTIMEIKKKLRKTVGYPLEFQRLYIRDHVEVKNHLRVIDLDGSKTLDEEDIKIDNITLPMLTFHIRLPRSSGNDLGTICFYGNPPRNKALFVLMMEAQAGLAQRFRPEIQLGGSAGTYVLRNQFKDRVACFKPFDEEPRAPNNPRAEYVGVLGDVGLREGIRSGQGCLREVAAFLIDSEHFHNVPYTCLCEASDDAFNYRGGKRTPKLGSFQQFVEHDTCMSDYSSSFLDADEVHKIGLLDLRIMNVDRNDGNVLVSFISSSGRASANSLENGDGACRRDSDERRALLIPIDHGYCLPDKIHVDPLDWCWYYWKQAKKPFSSSTIKYVDHIDVDKDAEMLHRDLKIDLPSLRTMRVSGRLMKIGVAKGLTLFEIAEMIAREEATEPSRLELTVNEAFELSRCRFLGDSAPTCSFELKSHGDEENLCNDIELLNLVHQGADVEESGSEISLSVSPYRVQSSNTSELPSEASPLAYSPRNDVAPPVKLTNAAPASARKGSSQVITSLDDDAYEYRGKVVEVDSEEDINSIPRSTPDAFAMVKPDTKGGFTRIPHVKTDCTSTACSSMSSSNNSPTSNFADDLWKNVLFEKDFYKTLEILITRDVDAVILAR